MFIPLLALVSALTLSANATTSQDLDIDVHYSNGYYSYLPNGVDDEVMNYGVLQYDIYIGDVNSFYDYNETNGSHSFELFSINLTDSTTGIVYNNYISCELNFDVQNLSFVQDSFTISFAQYDYEGGFDSDTGLPTYPYMNYLFYFSVEYINISTMESYSLSSSQMYPCLYSVWDETLDMINFNPSLSVDDHFVISISFLYLDESLFNFMLRGFNSNDYQSGYAQGYKNGESYGREQGVQDYLQSQAYQDALNQQFELGELQGISEGRQQVIDQGQTASIIFNGIISVGLLPVNVFLQMLNLEVFGINIGALVSSLLTIMVIIIIVRMVIGGKSGIDK